jgi:hypothetical protein
MRDEATWRKLSDMELYHFYSSIVRDISMSQEGQNGNNVAYIREMKLKYKILVRSKRCLNIEIRFCKRIVK